MFLELQVFPKSFEGQSVYPDVARRMVAAACDGFPIDPAIFARGDDGKTLQGVVGDMATGQGWGVPPRVTFGAGRGVVRVIGLGSSGCDLVSAQASLIATALGQHLRTEYVVKFVRGQCEIEQSRPHLYRIRELVISKKPRAFRRYEQDGAYTLESVRPLVMRAIVGGLVSQAQLLDDECPLEASREAQIGTDEMLGLKCLDGLIRIRRIRSGADGFAVVIQRLVISLDLDLKGLWYTGLLRSHGSGLLVPAGV